MKVVLKLFYYSLLTITLKVSVNTTQTKIILAIFISQKARKKGY